MGQSIKKTIIFIDIRDFTRESDRGEVAKFIASFVIDFYKSIKKIFSLDFFKFLGDGSMIISEIIDLSEILYKCYIIKEEFISLLEEYHEKTGVSLNLTLGFGITAGQVEKIQDEFESKHFALIDYLGSRINLASRLCSLARPSGIIIHKESFPVMLPEKYVDSFKLKQIEGIKGLETKKDLRCWVEKTIQDELLQVAKVMTIGSEVHVTGLCFYNNELILWKRPDNKEISPSQWAGPGGKIQGEMNFTEELKIKVENETKLKIKNIHFLDTYFIETLRIPGIIYYCEIDSTNVEFLTQNSSCRSFTLNEIIDNINDNILPDIMHITKAFDINISYSETKIRPKTKIRIQITHDCNYNCVTCHNENVRDKSEASSIISQFKSYSQLNNILEIDSITITGGEPLKTKELWQLIESIREQKSTIPIKLVTNAELISDEIIKKIKKHNIELKISIYGYIDSSVNEITRIKQENYFLEICEKIRTLYKEGISVSVNILASSLVVKDIPKIISHLKKINNNITIKVIEMVKPLNKEGQKYYTQIANEEALQQYIYKCCDNQCEKCFSKWGPIILPDGKIQVCKKTPDTVKNIFHDKISLNLVDYSKEFIMN